MVMYMSGRFRPVVDLAIPASEAVRTLLVPVLFQAGTSPLLLLPRGVSLILHAVGPAAVDRSVACEDAAALVATLPIPLIRASYRSVPAFERIPVAGEPTTCVDRVVVLPIFSHTGEPPPFDDDGDAWLHWVSLAALGATLLYSVAAHALVRAHTYYATISRDTLDSILKASTSFRSGARSPKLPRTAAADIAAPARRSSLTWREAKLQAAAADELLRRALLKLPAGEPFNDLMRQFADRILPLDENEVPMRFRADYALPDFADPRLWLTPFSTRVQPPVTQPAAPVAPQPAPSPTFKPSTLADLLTAQGTTELLEWYEDLYEWLMLVDELQHHLSKHRRARRERIAGYISRLRLGTTQGATYDSLIGTAHEFIVELSLDVTDALAHAIVHLYAPSIALTCTRQQNRQAVKRHHFNEALQRLHDGSPRPTDHVIVSHAITRGVTPLTAGHMPPQLVTDFRAALTAATAQYDGPDDDEIMARILAARPEPLALGKSRFVPAAHGVIWDLRTLPPKPLDFTAGTGTHLDLDVIKCWKKTFSSWPDQELWDHLIHGVRFKAPVKYQMVLQPHLSSLPLGYKNVHKELKRLVAKGYFSAYLHPPFCPWQTLPMGVAFRKLEPDRPRRTTDGGSPRRGPKPSQAIDAMGTSFRRRGGSDWLVDTDGQRVVPLNVGSRWAQDDVSRGTLEVFYQSWQKRVAPDGRASSPPPFHPLDVRSRTTSPLPQTAPCVLLAFAGPGAELDLGFTLRMLDLRTDELDKLTGSDVLIHSVAERYLARARGGSYLHAHISPPCRFFSVGADGRPVLFPVDQPLGLDPPPHEWAAYQAQGKAIIGFVADLLWALDEAGTSWTLENPACRHDPSSSAYWPEFAHCGTLWDALGALRLFESLPSKMVTFPYCALLPLGEEYQKYTTLCVSLKTAWLLEPFEGLVCVHRGKGTRHARRLRGFDREGASETASASGYPPRMISLLAHGIKRLASHGGVPSLVASAATPTHSQVSLSSDPAPPALRLGTVIDVDITRSGPTPSFSNPFKMGPHGTEGRLRGLAFATYREWLAARTVRAIDWPTALPVSKRLADLTGNQVEKDLRALFAKFGHTVRYHFSCGQRCFGKMCHGQPLIELARQILESTDDPPFPKEIKVTLAEIMNDAAVLKHLSYHTGLPLYQINTDDKDFFNQHYLHPMEQFRVGLITLDLDVLLSYAGRLRSHQPDLANLAEGVLGYGLFPGSEVAQRHAYLLTFVWLVKMFERSVPVVDALCQQYPIIEQWLKDRRAALEPPDNSLDATAAVRYGQARLFSASQYTDDGHKLTLGVDLTVLGLRVELEIKHDLKLDMAIVQKQSLGQYGTNQGIRLHTGLGLSYVPEDKLRRAFSGIDAAEAGSSTPREYQSTVGLLQSLLFVAGMRRSSTYGLWAFASDPQLMASERPFLPPVVSLDRLREWRKHLATCAGTSFEAGVERIHDDQRVQLPSEARVVFVFRSDASKQGTVLPGLGGSFGGSGWRYPNTRPLSEAELELPVAQTEFAAAFGEIEVYGDGVPDDALVYDEIDALASIDAMTEEAARSPAMQHIFTRLSQLPQWIRIRDRAILAHCAGDANVLADAFSRGYFEVAQQVCRQFGMTYERRPHGPRLAKLMEELVALNVQLHGGSPAATVSSFELEILDESSHDGLIDAQEADFWPVAEPSADVVPQAPDGEPPSLPPSAPGSEIGEDETSPCLADGPPPDRLGALLLRITLGLVLVLSLLAPAIGVLGLGREYRCCVHGDGAMTTAPLLVHESSNCFAHAIPGALSASSRLVESLSPVASARYALLHEPPPPLTPPIHVDLSSAPPALSPEVLVTGEPLVAPRAPVENPSVVRSLHATLVHSSEQSAAFLASTLQQAPLPFERTQPAPVRDTLGSSVARLLATDTSRLALRPTSFTLESLCDRLYDPTEATLPRTGKGQASAWKHWQAWCRLNNTDPWRLASHVTELDLRRESVLQAGYIQFVHLRQSTKPRNGRKAALPSSAAKSLAHIRKAHRDRDFPLPASHLVQVEVRKLLLKYKAVHGVKDLIPKRKQPFTRAILVDTLLGTPEGYKVGGVPVVRDSRRWRSFRGITTTLASTGFRKAEITVDKHGQPCDADCLSREHLRWRLRGKLYNSGSVPSELLSDPQAGDFAILTPAPSKSDPFDMVWGDKPIWLPFSTDPLSAFPALAQIELHDAFEGDAAATALFTGDDKLPFSGAQLDRALHAMLLRHFPAATSKLYSWHSARIWLATALLAAKATRAQIQALCRWQTEESLNIYACLGAGDYADLVTRAMAVNVDAARANSLADAVPFIDLADVQRARAQAVAAAPADTLDAAAANIDVAVDADDDADED